MRHFLSLPLIAIVMAGGAVSGQTDPKNKPLPTELQGVWNIVSGEEDGKPMRFARGDTVEIGECVLNQVIIQRDRVIMVDYSGGAMVFRAKVVATAQEKAILVYGDRCQTEREPGGVFAYRTNGDELICCNRSDRKVPTEFTSKKGSGQAVMLLKREK